MLVGVSRLLVLSALGALWAFGGSAAEAGDFHPCVPDASWAARPKLSALPGGSDGLTPDELGWIVYDSNQGDCWLADANLAGQPEVRAAGSLPVINPDGTMDWETALNWVNALNSYDNGRGWLNHSDWQLPCRDDPQNPYNDIPITTGDIRLEWPFGVGPFWHLQPGFYWACVRADGAASNGPCDLNQSAARGLEWSFDFDDGFEGTDLPNKQFYVMVYFPAQ